MSIIPVIKQKDRTVMKPKKIPHRTKLPVILTPKERDIIRDKTLGDPDFGNIGIVEGKNIKIMMSLDEIEDIQGYLAAEANHTKNKILQREVDRIFEKFQVFLDQYDDQETENDHFYHKTKNIE
jgi:hypothetical protein